MDIKLENEYGRIGFEWNGVWIVDPTLSECGRFEVDPATYYGLDPEMFERFKKANG